MAKGQVKKPKTNKPKLSPKQKKANKAAKQAAKAAKWVLQQGTLDTRTPCLRPLYERP
jgi:hypothetical protein